MEPRYKGAGLIKAGESLIERKRSSLIWLASCILAAIFLLDLIFFVHMLPPGNLIDWLALICSNVAAGMFFYIGALVWAHVYDRAVAWPLFGAFFLSTLSLIMQPVAQIRGFAVMICVCRTLAIPLLALVLLLFPKNYFKTVTRQATTGKTHAGWWNPFWGRYLIILSSLAIMITGLLLFNWFFSGLIPGWLTMFAGSYFLCGILGSFISANVTYRQSNSLRVRQQLQLFVGAILLSVVPYLVLTVIPQLLHFPPMVIVDPRISSLIFILIPLSLGYAILRYQLLFFDTRVLQVVVWFVAAPGLIVLAYLVVIVGFWLFRTETLLSDIFVAVMLVWLAPMVRKISQLVAERWIFSEMLTYRRLLQDPACTCADVTDLKAVVRPFTRALDTVLESPTTCLFLFDEETGYYRLYPPLEPGNPADQERLQLLEMILNAVNPALNSTMDFLSLYEPMVERLAKAPRPLFLSEASYITEAEMAESSFLWKRAPFVGAHEPLLIPLHSAGKMIGLLITGVRSERAFYAGADLEALDMILTRFVSQFEAALLYAQGLRHMDILNAMYTIGSMPMFKTLNEAANAYAKVAAEAVLAAAEIWLFNEETSRLRCIIHEGFGPYLVSNHIDTLEARDPADWESCFYEGQTVISPVDAIRRVPPCFPMSPGFPIAWIPLKRVQRPIGVLVLTYPRPHLFSQAEQRIFELFANQCAAVLENTMITQELRVAYEQQKELDRLKDQFIVTASHELRTPLTAVQGYIELLGDYDGRLSSADRSEFIAKAHRGCDELVLLVGNIMDASRVQVDAEQMNLVEVPLRASALHVAEILDSTVRREERHLQVAIPPDLVVLADSLHLRQILLNLVGNALQYSEVGQQIEIYSDADADTVTVYVRDYGPGVPVKEQGRLFERFVRLDRDMNSPNRGAGLGLYICKQLIEAMGGRIWMESQGVPGEGCIFAFTLKRVQVEPQEIQKLLKHQEI